MRNMFKALLFSCFVGYATLASAACGLEDQYDPLFPNLPDQGEISATLHPGPTVVPGEEIVVGFGVPFSKNTLANAGLISVADAQGNDLPTASLETNRWRSINGSNESVRSALVYIKVKFDDLSPKDVVIKYGQSPVSSFSPPADVKTTWVSIASGVNPDEYPASENIQEPAVYVTLSTEWLSIAGAKTRTTPVGSDSNFAFFDEFSIGAANTATNNIPGGSVNPTSPINYLQSKVAWQYDRALAFFNVYTRTGDVQWLRSAHRAAQFYAKHIQSNGLFTLAPTQPIYSYGESMLMDLMFLGDVGLSAKIQNVASAWNSFNPVYTPGNFWTERNMAYKLWSVLSAWEATGDSAYLIKIQQIIAAIMSHAANPPMGWNNDGCLLHICDDHDPDEPCDQEPICSPWMSVILVDAVKDYYYLTEDPDALTFFKNIAYYVRNQVIRDPDGVADGDDRDDEPGYLASSYYFNFGSNTPPMPNEGLRHACDIAGMVTTGAWAQKQLNEDPSELVETANLLVARCTNFLQSPDMFNPNATNSAVYAIGLDSSVFPSDGRRFGWIFSQTADLPWMLCQASQDLPKDYGDAIDPAAGTGVQNYNTVETDEGASNILSSFYLGACVDGNDSGFLQDVKAKADDIDAGSIVKGACSNHDDEDGIRKRVTDFFEQGRLAKIEVKASNKGYLSLWADFNHDGDWLDAEENLLVGLEIQPGSNFLQFKIPSSALDGNTYFRFRFGKYPVDSPIGRGLEGETEDHILYIGRGIDPGPGPTHPGGEPGFGGDFGGNIIKNSDKKMQQWAPIKIELK